VEGTSRRVKTIMLEKIVEILTVARQPVLKCHIMSKCAFSSRTFRPYITLLIQSGLLDAYPAIDLRLSGHPTTRHRMIYQTNKKGMEFLKRYNELLMLLETIPKQKV
jgi:predicted transcriptional regulator